MADNDDKKDLHGRAAHAGKSLFSKFSNSAKLPPQAALDVRLKLEAEQRELARRQQEEDDLLNGKGLPDNPSQTQVTERLEAITMHRVAKAAAENDPKSEYNKRRSSIASMEALLEGKLGLASAGAHKSFVTGIETMLGDKATTTALAQIHKSPSLAPQAAKMAKMTTSQIEQIGLQARADSEDAANEIRSIAADMKPGDDGKRLHETTQKYDKAIESQGISDRALAKQRKTKTDLESVYDTAGDFGAKLDKKTRDEKAVAQVRAGGSENTRASITAGHAEAEKTASEAEKKFRTAFETGASEADDLGRAFQAAKEKVEIFGVKLDDIKKHGDKPEKFIETTVKAISALASVGSAAGDMYRTHNVTVHQSEKAANTGLIGVSNQMYDDAKAASRGDAAAIMRQRRQKESTAYGIEIAESEMKAYTLNKAGIAGDAIARTGSAYAKADIAGGLDAAARGVVNTDSAIMLADSHKAETFLTARATDAAEKEAKDYITAAQVQTGIDFTRSSYHSTAGAGSKRTGLISTLRDKEYLKDMAGLGLDLEATGQLTNIGVQQLGGEYRAKDAKKAGMAAALGQVESHAAYMALAGQMSSVGGTTDDLEKTLANAVKLGMDSSKSIAQMTATMVGMASFSARGGVSTLGGAQALTISGLAAAKEAGISENMRAGVVDYAAQRYQESAQDRGISIATIAHQGALMRKLDLNPGSLAAQAAGSMSTTQISSMRQELLAIENNKTLNDTERKEKGREVASKFGQIAWWEQAGGIKSKDLGILGGEMVTKTLNRETQGWVHDLKKQQNMLQVAREMQENPNKKWTSKEDKARMQDAEASFAAFTQAKTGAAGNFKTFAATGNVEAALKKGQTDQEKRKQVEKGKDDALKMDSASATGKLTEYIAGLGKINTELGGMSGVIEKMSSSAALLDGKQFEKSVSGAAGALNTAIDNLRETVDALNIKLGGKVDETNKSLGNNAVGNDKKPLNTSIPSTTGFPREAMKGI